MNNFNSLENENWRNLYEKKKKIKKKKKKKKKRKQINSGKKFKQGKEDKD